MPDIQEVWTRLEDNKKEAREINRIRRDMLTNSPEYADLKDELDTLKARKKQFEDGISSQMSDKMERLEMLKHAIAEDREIMADIALRDLLNGKPVSVRGAADEEYEPSFAVRFRRKN